MNSTRRHCKRCGEAVAYHETPWKSGTETTNWYHVRTNNFYCNADMRDGWPLKIAQVDNKQGIINEFYTNDH